MSNKLPPLNWLRSFEVAARRLNFTLAAEELSLSQAAVSKQVKNLEYSLGVTLFKRLPRGLELTESGAAYLPAVHEAIERLGAATNELFSYSQNNVLKLKVSMVFLKTWLAPRLPDFHQQHPDIELNLQSTIWVSDPDVEQNSDLEIRYGHGDWPELNSDRLTRDSLIPVCSPQVAEHSLKSLQDLKHHTLLNVAGYEEGWEYWLSQVFSEKIQINREWHFDSLIVALEVAAAGMGVALGRSSLVEQMLESGKLVAPFDKLVETQEAFFLVYQSAPSAGSREALFRDWLLSKVES